MLAIAQRQAEVVLKEKTKISVCPVLKYNQWHFLQNNLQIQ